jgi:site-specific recombinase XerD
MEKLLQQYKRDLALRGFSKNTQKTYFYSVRIFLNYFKKNPTLITEDEIKDFLYYMNTEKDLSNSSIKQYHGALKFLYTQTLKMDWNVYNIPQMKKIKVLPEVFSFDEVITILKNTSNFKHKVILMLIYSSGLRVSECSTLKPTDIIRTKMRVRITQGKGAKDRLTILSRVCLKHLIEYWKTYRPTEWLFEGNKKKVISK